MADREGGGDFSFGGESSLDDGSAVRPRLEIANPQLVWLLLGVVASVAGLTIALLLGQLILPAAAAWLLSGPLAIGLLAFFVHSESKRHAMPTYVDAGWVKAAYVLAMVLALVAVVVSAIRIALWVGRL